VRLAGQATENPEVFETIRKHLRSDGVPSDAANHLTSEMIAHGTDVDSSVEHFTRMYENFKSKGFDDEAAQALAVEAMEGRQDEPKESLRFARCVGDVVEGGCSPESALMDCLNMEDTSFTVPDGTSREDIAAISERLTGIRPDRVIMG